MDGPKTCPSCGCLFRHDNLQAKFQGDYCSQRCQERFPDKTFTEPPDIPGKINATGKHIARLRRRGRQVGLR
jgi:hypothetical protein